MKLYYDRRAKDPIYYAQIGYRDSKGKSTTRNYKRIGKHSELLAITDDPLSYAKEEIKRLNEEFRVGKSEFSISVDFNQKVTPSDHEFSHSEAVNIGYFFIQYIYQKLELHKFFGELTSNRRFAFDSDAIHRFLVYSRMLDPRSKFSTHARLDHYFEKPDFTYDSIFEVMELLADHSKEYLSWLYQKSNSVIQRDTSVLYYDCTNYYFEAEQEDEGIIDEVTGESLRGFRQYGVSKEHRPNPIVQMGLFMDKNGIPLSMCLDPGNTSEQLTAIPLEKDVIQALDHTDFIYCADAGLGSLNIRRFNDMGGRHFIVTQSVKKLSDPLKEAVFNDFDYKLLSSDQDVTLDYMKSFDKNDPNNRSLYNDWAYKVICADKAVDLGLTELKELQNGKTAKRKSYATLKQKVIITFSRKMMEYQRTVRAKQIERARRSLNGDPEEIKKGNNDVKRFLKRICTDKNGNKVKVRYELDMDKIHEEEKYDGFYAVATNLDYPAQKVLNIAHKRYQIEDCFRIMKTNFDARPVYHYKEEMIKAHFLICYTTLLIYRLMECKLKETATSDLAIPSVNALIETMKNMNVVNVHDQYWMAIYEDSQALDQLVKITSLQLNRKYYKPKELNKIIKKLQK